MISVFDIDNNTNYGRNGDAILHPSSCKVTEDAGGQYELEMVHPVDPEGGWAHLVNGAVVKAPLPVPLPMVGQSIVGSEADIYVATSDAIMYESMASGAPALLTVASGTEVYLLRNMGSGWLNIMTKYGIEGYASSSAFEYDRHGEVEQVTPDRETDQLFRIYKNVIDSDRQTITVNARHVSYDLSGVIIKDCDISLMEPAAAIEKIQDCMMIDYAGNIQTNMTGDYNGTYTGDLSGKNASYAFLDPDKGMIAYFRGKLIRDNWDIYLLKNDVVNRGVRLTYGVNLRGVKWTRNGDNLINRVVPVAKDENGDDFYLPEKWIDSEFIADWPCIRMEMLKVDGQIGKDDGTETGTTWTEATLKTHMREKAEERFTVDHADAETVELTVNFTLLGDAVEYEQYRGLQQVYLYDIVTIRDARIGMDLQLQVSQIVWDCLLHRYISIKIGNVYDYGGRTVFGYSIGDGAINYEKISMGAIRRLVSEVNSSGPVS